MVEISQRYDRIVFHRPSINESTVDYFTDPENAGKNIADMDDLIFDLRFASETPAVKVRGEHLGTVQRQLSAIMDALLNFRQITVSTVPLRTHFVDHLKFPESSVHILPNALDPGIIGLSRVARQKWRDRKRPFTYGYLSGTASHDLDFEVAAPALAYALATRQQSKMLVVGPVELPAVLLPYADRIEQRSVVPFSRLPFIMAQIETVIAPLEDTIFTRAKSGLKFFEAAIVGCNVVATPIPDIDRFESPLLRKCRTLDEWKDALTRPWSISEIERDREALDVAEDVSIARQADRWISIFLD